MRGVAEDEEGEEVVGVDEAEGHHTQEQTLHRLLWTVSKFGWLCEQAR